MALSLSDYHAVATAIANRIQAAMATAAGQVYSESWFANASQQAASGTKTITFGSIPGWVTPGTSITDLSHISVIPTGTVVTGTASVGGTQVNVTISAALNGTLTLGDTVSFPAHVQRAAFANQVAQGTYNMFLAAMLVLTNSTIAAEAINDGTDQSGHVPDTDIQFAVNSFWSALAGA